MTTAGNIAESIQPLPKPSPAQIMCSECGACADAACNCGAPYVPAKERAMAAIEANPEKSDRAIAAELGVGHATVSRARAVVSGETGEPGVSGETPRKRVGKDGKRYSAKAKVFKKKLSPAAIEVHQQHDAERDRLDAEAVAIIGRLRETLADNEDVMALCGYIEWYVEGSPVWPGCGTDLRIWRRTYRPVVQKPDETMHTRTRRDH
jgi:hypothetical protein